MSLMDMRQNSTLVNGAGCGRRATSSRAFGPMLTTYRIQKPVPESPSSSPGFGSAIVGFTFGRERRILPGSSSRTFSYNHQWTRNVLIVKICLCSLAFETKNNHDLMDTYEMKSDFRRLRTYSRSTPIYTVRPSSPRMRSTVV